jgi:hypothetical protein
MRFRPTLFHNDSIPSLIIVSSLTSSSRTPLTGSTHGCTIIPVELKTGKASMQISHRAQVMLYVLMLFVREHSSGSLDRTQGGEQGPRLRPPTHGILLYLNGETTKSEAISPKWSEICSLAISRNDLAGHIKHSSSLVIAILI